jgi:hypothetical protein
MPCDTWRSVPQQTLTERKKEIVATVEDLARKLARGQVKAVVGPQGAIAFEGWNGINNAGKNGVTDACALRMVMAKGGSLARMEIAKAEAAAGRKLDMKVVASGVHAHGGVWHGGHKR